MKKLLLFGKLNDVTRDLNTYLSRYFQVQLCLDNIELSKGTMKLYEPDLVLISLVGLYEIHNGFFTELYQEYNRIPVLTLGTEQEKNIFLAYYGSNQFQHLTNQFQHLTRPLGNLDIMREICRCLRLDMKEMVKEYEKMIDSRKRILMVDDDAVFLRAMKKMLEPTYQVSVAISAVQAMTIMGRQKPDLLILDYNMPICNGKMMLEMLRADEKMKDVPVIFLTGISQKEHIMEVLELKPAGYFLKPPHWMLC